MVTPLWLAIRVIWSLKSILFDFGVFTFRPDEKTKLENYTYCILHFNGTWVCSVIYRAGQKTNRKIDCLT